MGKVAGAKAHTFVDGKWVEGQPPVLAPLNLGAWLSFMVFDGARAFDGVAPDLDRHCARVVTSARIMGLGPTLEGPEIEELAWQGIRRFPAGAPLYICPMYYAEDGFLIPDPDATRFVLSVYEAPLPEPDGFAATLTRFRRPARDMAPTDAKASCLYPNVARGVAEARERGCDTGVVLDPNGNVAEFSYTNLFMAKDGVVHTPAANGTFLDGLTRQRVIGLLRDDGVEVIERAVDYAEVKAADELFSTGNYTKVMPCTRIDDRHLQAGPMFRRARELYFAFARAGAKAG
jgi:branched-chain amino acid aminotransferase